MDHKEKILNGLVEANRVGTKRAAGDQGDNFLCKSERLPEKKGRKEVTPEFVQIVEVEETNRQWSQPYK